MSTTYVSLLEAAGLELKGTRARLLRAGAAIREFHHLHGNPREQVRAEGFLHHDALMAEYHVLLIELDDAERQDQAAQKRYAELKQAELCERKG